MPTARTFGAPDPRRGVDLAAACDAFGACAEEPALGVAGFPVACRGRAAGRAGGPALLGAADPEPAPAP